MMLSSVVYDVRLMYGSIVQLLRTTLVYNAKEHLGNSIIRVTLYNDTNHEKKESAQIEEQIVRSATPAISIPRRPN